MPDEPNKWSEVNKQLARRERGDLPLNPDRPLEVPASLSQSASGIQSPDGVIANFKANLIQRRAALQQIRAYADEQLNVVKHMLSEASRVRRTEITLKAEEFLRDLSARHLANLQQIGLQNIAMHNNVVEDLMNEVSKTLGQFSGADWPEALKQDAIGSVMKQYKRFLDQLDLELGK